MVDFLPKAILLDLDDTILAFSQGALPCWQAICRTAMVPGSLFRWEPAYWLSHYF